MSILHMTSYHQMKPIDHLHIDHFDNMTAAKCLRIENLMQTSQKYSDLLRQDPALILPVVTLQTSGTLGLSGGRWGPLTHNDGLLT